MLAGYCLQEDQHSGVEISKAQGISQLIEDCVTLPYKLYLVNFFQTREKIISVLRELLQDLQDEGTETDSKVKATRGKTAEVRKVVLCRHES